VVFSRSKGVAPEPWSQVCKSINLFPELPLSAAVSVCAARLLQLVAPLLCSHNCNCIGAAQTLPESVGYACEWSGAQPRGERYRFEAVHVGILHSITGSLAVSERDVIVSALRCMLLRMLRLLRSDSGLRLAA
jgi:hypothetical protein